MTSQPDLLTLSSPCTRTSSGCFIKGTLVRTPDGMFPIERLGVGDLVITQDGRGARIAKAHSALATEIVRVQFSDGSTIFSTPWHLSLIHI